MKARYTYDLGRECRNCLEPIADQTHALRTFCERVKLDDGSILSCKDDYNSALRKVEKAPFKVFATHQENMRDRLRSLFNRHGEIVSVELLNRWGIMLNRPAEIEWTNDGSQIFYFIEFAVVKTNQNQFKIITHGKVF
jgi:hypothetical protein